MNKEIRTKAPLCADHFILLCILFFLSGTAGLIFQVIWMYRLGLVFGNAAYATAATLSAFFLGLGLGGWFLGRASAKFRRPLKMYGLMELGVALTALLFVPGLEFYEMYYAESISFLGNSKGILLPMKFIFSALLLILPSFLMGGTFPVLSQYIGKNRTQLSKRGTVLYAVNTVGAALGALLTGFYLILEYGVSFTYYLAVALMFSVGLLAVVLDSLSTPTTVVRKTSRTSIAQGKSFGGPSKLGNLQFIIVAFSSGALALSAETLWTQMFAQVLQNSVYSFALILVVFLLALGMGGFLSHLLVRSRMGSNRVIVLLLSIAAVFIGISPTIFNLATNGLEYVAMGASWHTYVWAVFKLALLVVLPPTVVLGAVFPFLLKAAPVTNRPAGRIVGVLVFFNSLGSFAGPAIAGFVLLDILGLWNSVKVIAIFYGILAVWVFFSFYGEKKNVRLLLPILIVSGILLLKNPPLLRLETDEKLLDSWQSSDGVVSIVRKSKNIQMRLDNFYVLGDSESVLVEQMQAHIPLMIHPAPKKVAFLGMGTGITAGAALYHDVEKVVAVELVSNVIPAAQGYFSPWANGLFQDSRASIVADDGRNFLLGTKEQFDVIVGDLFTPWHAGTGSLYSLEHFEQAKKRLGAGGVFAQWLPLYQLTPENFYTIAATFAAVFPHVTLWRADFSATRASIVLIGQEAGVQLDEDTLRRNIVHVTGGQDNQDKSHMAGLFYLGNLNNIGNRLSHVELNTDDRRAIEFKAPILSQQANAGRANYIVGKELANLFVEISDNFSRNDPYLSGLPIDEIKFVEVGALYFRYLQYIDQRKDVMAKKTYDKIQTLAPGFLKKDIKAGE